MLHGYVSAIDRLTEEGLRGEAKVLTLVVLVKLVVRLFLGCLLVDECSGAFAFLETAESPGSGAWDGFGRLSEHAED